MDLVWIVLLCSLCGTLQGAQTLPVLVPLVNGVAQPNHVALDFTTLTTDRQGVDTVACASNDAITSDIYYPGGYKTNTIGGRLTAGYFFQVRRDSVSGGQHAIYLSRKDDNNTSVLDRNSGIWSCELNDGNGGFHNVYFGLYYRGNGTSHGALSMCQTIGFQVSSLMTEPLTYNLTCETTGGPPTDFNWTINGAAIPNSVADRSLSQRTDSSYTNTLVVTGRQSGIIRFAASNTFTPSGLYQQITVVFPPPPSNIQAIQIAERQVQVTWDRPTSGYSEILVFVNDEHSPIKLSSSDSSLILTLPPGTHTISVATFSTLHKTPVASDRIAALIQVFDKFPPPPSNVQAIQIADRQVKVIWDLDRQTQANGFYAILVFVNDEQSPVELPSSASSLTLTLPPGTYVISVATRSTVHTDSKPVTSDRIFAAVHVFDKFPSTLSNGSKLMLPSSESCCQHQYISIGAVVSTSFVTIMLYTILLAVLVVCYSKRQSALIRLVQTTKQHHVEQTESPVYDTVETRPGMNEMKRCAAYGDRQHTDLDLQQQWSLDPDEDEYDKPDLPS